MNEQPTSPNLAVPGESAAGAVPEHLQSAPQERVPAREVAPQPGANPGAAAPPPAASQTPAKLSTDDIAKAIAAVPGPSVASGAVPTPTMAGDIDVIEPEWVDKAEQTVRAHQGDPYGEEEAVEDLQIEYLQKRYGHTVGDPKSENSKPEGK